MPLTPVFDFKEYHQLKRKELKTLLLDHLLERQIMSGTHGAFGKNADIADRISEATTFDLGHDVKTRHGNVTAMYLDKARSTTHRLYRDSSALGAPERKDDSSNVL